MKRMARFQQTLASQASIEKHGRELLLLGSSPSSDETEEQKSRKALFIDEWINAGRQQLAVLGVALTGQRQGHIWIFAEGHQLFLAAKTIGPAPELPAGRLAPTAALGCAWTQKDANHSIY
jgi:hypothetical protein